jgi:hypothetical protein
MKTLNPFYLVFFIVLTLSACGLDNERSTKEDVRQGGNNVDYKKGAESGSPSLSDTTRAPQRVDSSGYQEKNRQ